MSEERSLASLVYPDLKSSAAPPERASAPDRSSAGAAGTPTPAQPPSSLAEAIYGSEPADGAEKARNLIEEGRAKPAAETEAAPERAATEGAAPSQLAQFNNLAREAGLSSARTEQMLKLHNEAMAEVSTKYWADQGATWEKQSKAQFGSRLDGMVNEVRPLLNDPRITPPAFRALLEQYRIGSHPVVIDTLYRWSQMRRGR